MARFTLRVVRLALILGVGASLTGIAHGGMNECTSSIGTDCVASSKASLDFEPISDFTVDSTNVGGGFRELTIDLSFIEISYITDPIKCGVLYNEISSPEEAHVYCQTTSDLFMEPSLSDISATLSFRTRAPEISLHVLEGSALRPGIRFLGKF